MWVATKRVETVYGTVDAGRLVPDGDPIMAGNEDAFARVDLGGAPVEEATAEPGRKRVTRR